MNNKYWCKREDCGEPVWILYFALFGDDEEICEIRQDDDGDWIINSAVLRMDWELMDLEISSLEEAQADAERLVEEHYTDQRNYYRDLLDKFKDDNHIANGKYVSAEATEAEAIAAWNRRADGWISVEERLPEKGDYYYATDGKNKFIARFAHGAWTVDTCRAYSALWHVTHWQPLPEAPKGE